MRFSLSLQIHTLRCRYGFVHPSMGTMMTLCKAIQSGTGMDPLCIEMCAHYVETGPRRHL